MAIKTDGEPKRGRFWEANEDMLRRFALAVIMPQQAAEAILALNLTDGKGLQVSNSIRAIAGASQAQYRRIPSALRAHFKRITSHNWRFFGCVCQQNHQQTNPDRDPPRWTHTGAIQCNEFFNSIFILCIFVHLVKAANRAEVVYDALKKISDYSRPTPAHIDTPPAPNMKAFVFDLGNMRSGRAMSPR